MSAGQHFIYEEKYQKSWSLKKSHQREWPICATPIVCLKAHMIILLLLL